MQNTSERPVVTTSGGMGSSNLTTHVQDPHRLEPEDVFAVRSTILKFVPIELANQILDEAKYWPKATWDYQPEEGWELIVGESEPQNNATVCCLLTPKLSELIICRSAIKVKAVCFKILSHDQGWCDEDDFDGQYDGSWTWFEAAIIRDSFMGTQRPGTLNSKSKELVAQVVCKLRGDVDVEDPDGELMIVKSPDDDNPHVWKVLRNKRASNEYRLHTIIWTEEDEAADELILMAENGKGLGRGFVKSLKMNDKIAILARAQYLGWVNYIKRVELEIYYSV